MHDWNPDWDRKLAQPPLQGKRFTREMMAEVENRVNGASRRKEYGRSLRTAGVAAALSVVLVTGGVLAVKEMRGNLQGPIADPGPLASPSLTPGHTLGSGQPSAPGAVTPPASLSLALKTGEGGDLDWWNDLDLESYDESGDAIVIAFVQSLMQRKLGAMGSLPVESDRLWENPEEKQVLAEYELSSPWIPEVHVGVISENDEHRTYELRLLLTDSTRSEIRETIKVLVGKRTHKISKVETPSSGDYLLRVNDSFISLGDWDDEYDWAELLGTPLSEKVEQLQNADTFTGSFIKSLVYDGLEMKLFSPSHNGKTFWIMSMHASKEGYSTSKGIEVGSTFEDMKRAYPDISLIEGSGPNHGTYELADEREYDQLRFEVRDGRISGILIEQLLP